MSPSMLWVREHHRLGLATTGSNLAARAFWAHGVGAVAPGVSAGILKQRAATVTQGAS